MSTQATTTELFDFRRRAVSTTAFGLGTGMALLTAVLLHSGRASGPGPVLLVAGTALHFAVALGARRVWWRPSGWCTTTYLLGLVGLSVVALADAGTPDTDVFWFLLVPIGLGPIVLDRRRSVLLLVATLLGYVAGSLSGPGLPLVHATPRVLALLVHWWALTAIGHRLCQALGRAEDARHDAETSLAAEREVNERLRELDRLKDDFVSTASHELRTPVTLILGLSATLDRHWDRLADDQRRDLATRVAAHAQGLEGIVTTILDTARIERGTLRAAPRHLHVGEVVHACLERAATLLRQHRLTVDGALDVHVHTDPQLLDRVLDNLLANAARHTPVDTAVRITVTACDDEVRICVFDDGPGIPAGELARLGEPFFRAGDADTRTRDGVGLGLALVKQVLEALGSRLEVRSEEGCGASFSFVLPRHERADGGDATPQRDLPGAAPAPATGPRAPASSALAP